MKADRSAESVRSEINVTPLVDVCLVMLVIFMVVTPMFGPHKDVKLPQAPNPEEQPKDGRRILVALKADGTVWLGGRPLPAEALADALRELHARAPGKEVVLMADGALTFGDVKKVLVLVRASGWANANLAAVKKPK